MWNRFTNLGDLAVMLPLAVTIAVWLAAQKHFSSSLRWLLAFGSAGLLVAISKIAFIGWGIGSRDFDFTGISGHTMLATATLPVLLFLLSRAWLPRYSTMALAIGWLGGAAIGYSRLEVHAHSLSEVVLGFACGLLASSWFASKTAERYSPKAAWYLLGLALIVFNLQFGNKAPGQDLITRLALILSSHDIPYTRGSY
ncbi:phosphatase PAP2 family protein [Aquitalea sp. LB_tupeE]|uniref:phosphatase PAP2 family protein n=1 Tax=Aquitalea sp. LB_tupeE TaxID=2748078 RepID=UPI0015C083DE|nr:phosphatase PAP2 family protein [Aquitalea sp. LB_tupeE]NWK79447.1 phosphatase PAP2 family protein [Aquitalea sp. LB_tupeE]